MKALKVMTVMCVIFLFIVSGVYAAGKSTGKAGGYKNDIINGNKAYKAQKWDDALAWYEKAYKEKPSEQLKTLIAAIERKIDAENNAPENAVTKNTAPKKDEKPLELGPIMLIGLDVILAGAAGFMVFYEGRAQEDYIELYNEINNTTPENYDRLVKKQKETYLIMTLEAVVISAASAALIYTLGDAFITHEVFKQDVSLNAGIKNDLAYIKIERSF